MFDAEIPLLAANAGTTLKSTDHILIKQVPVLIRLKCLYTSARNLTNL